MRTLVSGGARISGCVPIYVSFRTSPQTGVGISIVIENAFFQRWRLPRQCALLYRNDREFDTAQVRETILYPFAFAAVSLTGNRKAQPCFFMQWK